MSCIHSHWVWCKTDLKGSPNIWGENNSFFHYFLTIFLLSVGHTKKFEMSMCALKSFFFQVRPANLLFLFVIDSFLFLCFSIASSRCLCYLFKRTVSPFRCTFLSCLLLISFQHKLAFPFFLFSKFFFLFPLFVRPALSIILTPH